MSERCGGSETGVCSFCAYIERSLPDRTMRYMRRISRPVLLSVTAFVALASSSVAWSVKLELEPIHGTYMLGPEVSRIVADPNAGKLVVDRATSKVIFEPNPGVIVLDVDVGSIDVGPNAGQFVFDTKIEKYVLDQNSASNESGDTRGSEKFVFDPNAGKIVLDPAIGKLVFEPDPESGTLEPEVAECIRGKGTELWHECYNLQKSVRPEERVEAGFKGFHDDMFRHDTKIRSIWVPSPAERWSRARDREG